MDLLSLSNKERVQKVVDQINQGDLQPEEDGEIQIREVKESKGKFPSFETPKLAGNRVPIKLLRPAKSDSSFLTHVSEDGKTQTLVYSSLHRPHNGEKVVLSYGNKVEIFTVQCDPNIPSNVAIDIVTIINDEFHYSLAVISGSWRVVKLWPEEHQIFWS